MRHYPDNIARAVCLVWLLALAPAFAQETYRLEIEAPEPLRTLLRENLDMAKWLESPEMNPDFFRRLFARATPQVKTLLATEGYYAPAIAADIEQRDGTWVARFVIEPGAQMHVAEVELAFRGDIVVADTAAQAQQNGAREAWPLKAGDVFRQAEWEAAKRGLLRGLLIERFPAARIVDSRASVHPKNGEARLFVEIDSGPLFTFGELEVEGLERYPRSLVERLNPIKAGSSYQQTQILELQSRLYDSGFFQSAEVQVETDPARPEHVPVRVRVIEAPSKRLGFGVGYSTDTRARVQIQYDDKNIRDRAWWFKSGLEVNEVRQSGSVQLDFPPRASFARDSIAGSITHEDVSGEETETARLGVSRSQRVGRFERTLALQYQTEVRGVAGVADEDTRQALTATASWTRRDVDNLLYPTRGYIVNMQIGGAHEALLTDQSFLRGYVRAARYYPLGARGSLLLRGEVGSVQADSRQGIPSDFLFRAGGDQSVRGYAFHSLGVQEGEAIVGGRYLAVGSVEYTHWLTEQWGAAIFYDIGDAADERDEWEAVAGFGAGVRWRSPAGPVNFDVAYGEETNRYRLHVAVGFVF